MDKTAIYLVLLLNIGFIIGQNSDIEKKLDPATTDSQQDSCDNIQYSGAKLPPGFDIIYPVISKKNQVFPIYTFNPDTKSHRRHIAVRFSYKGERHRLKLQHNSKLLSEKIKNGVNTYDQDEDCYYQGYCSKKDHLDNENFVSLSTCDGMRGVIQIDGISHMVYPQDGSDSAALCRPHLIYRMSSTKDRTCGNQSGQWTPFETLHKSEFFEKMQDVKFNSRVKRSFEPKYLELAMILDKTMFEMFGLDEDRANEFVLQVTNMIDMYYQSLNIRVGLVYSEFWTRDKMIITSNPRETLQNMLLFSESQLRANYDLVHLISGRVFDGNSSGLAVPDSICTGRGVAVISSPGDNSRHLASVISHMIGHNIGLLHDTNDCVCDDGRDTGCIMDKNIGMRSPVKFSSCSTTRLEVLTKVGLGSCLNDEPADNSYPQFCGNGFVERGEQCDCGPAGNCHEVDPCCDPETCLLKFWAKCRSGPCCENCLPKSSNEVCREANGECDAAEYCDGVSGECPANALILDGQPCMKGRGYCHQGQCPSHDSQCQKYWGTESVTAHDQCYTYNNPLGSLFGHCGLDSDGQPIKCPIQDSFCGLLQCEGGSTQLNFRTTSAGVRGQEQFKCMTITTSVNGDLSNIGMVPDGTKCADSKICINHQCTALDVPNLNSCPQGVNNRTCSDHGRCTTVDTCSCDAGYSGHLCDVVLPTSSSVVVGTGTTDDDSRSNSGLETKWLIVIICLVAIVVVVALILGFVFCRRQVVSPSRKKPIKKQTSHLNESMDNGVDRTISFGLTPSYRNEKDGKRKRRRKRRPSSSSGESDSDDRKLDGLRPDIQIPEELSRQPERGILKKSTSSAFEGLEAERDECGSQCSCSDSGSCSCSEQEEDHHHHRVHKDTSGTTAIQESAQEIPPPLEFDTNNMYTKKVETRVQVEVNPCQQPSEISPTNSEDMKYSAPESGQVYSDFRPYDKYNQSMQLPLSSHHHGGADSATDSAIDMPADGSVSTINEIPPHHSTMVSSYNKHTPNIADYSDMQSQSDGSPTDPRTKAMYRPSPQKYSKPGLPQNGYSKSPSTEQHPVIYEYQRPPTNRALDKHDSNYQHTFQTSNGSAPSREPHLNPLDMNNTRLDESFTV